MALLCQLPSPTACSNRPLQLLRVGKHLSLQRGLSQLPRALDRSVRRSVPLQTPYFGGKYGHGRTTAPAREIAASASASASADSSASADDGSGAIAVHSRAQSAKYRIFKFNSLFASIMALHASSTCMIASGIRPPLLPTQPAFGQLEINSCLLHSLQPPQRSPGCGQRTLPCARARNRCRLLSPPCRMPRCQPSGPGVAQGLSLDTYQHPARSRFHTRLSEHAA